MPSLRDIRNRIGSVKSTRQITKAMKMVAAAKLRRAQDAVLKTRPYAQLLEQALGRVAQRASDDAKSEMKSRMAAEYGGVHPLLTPRAERIAEVVVITSDRGLAGGFNSNVIRRVQRFMTENAEQYEKIHLSTMGRKARDFFRRGGDQRQTDNNRPFRQAEEMRVEDRLQERHSTNKHQQSNRKSNRILHITIREHTDLE